jgi:hypothetical protein
VVAGYIKAAALWLETEHRQNITTYSLTSSGTKSNWHLLLSDLIATQHAWCKPQKKKEPFNFAIFEFLHKSVSATAMHDQQTLLSRAAAIFDRTGLGLHTCSRLAKPGQSKPKKGSLLLDSPKSLRRSSPRFVQRGFPLS